MAYKKIKGKTLTWYHVSKYTEADLEFLQKNFKFHQLDFEDLRDFTELPKIDVYKYYLFAIFSIPKYDKINRRVGKSDMAIFISDDHVVTVSRKKIKVIDDFFNKVSHNTGLNRDALGRTTGYLVYKMLDSAFHNAKSVLQALAEETNSVEEELQDHHTKETTLRLGALRRNLLFMRHVIDPQRLLILQLINTKKNFLPNELNVYFDNLKDALDGVWVMADNFKNIVDGLFDLNEALLSHRTNEIIRMLTIISVILMPPTLIASYYGMNVQNLPFAHDISIVSAVIIASLIIFWLLVWVIDKRK
ncbi:magnesium transporter CorA family protein [Patescibacteria group bacterium]|nr:magnesium transporter CorA family protein [Patescibacteria group bacterium]